MGTTNTYVHARIDVRIEEKSDEQEQSALADNPLCSMWQDRKEIDDVAAYASQLRATRQAIAELEAGKGKKFANVDDLMLDLQADLIDS